MLSYQPVLWECCSSAAQSTFTKYLHSQSGEAIIFSTSAFLQMRILPKCSNNIFYGFGIKLLSGKTPKKYLENVYIIRQKEVVFFFRPFATGVWLRFLKVSVRT